MQYKMIKRGGYIPWIYAECFTQTGRFHMKNNDMCEDVYIAKEEKNFLFYGLADGQSGKKFCRQGAYAVLNALEEYIEKQGIDHLSEYEHVDEIQYEIIKMIREQLADLAAKNNAEICEFSSTILALGIDSKTGKYVMVHLGDGGIFGSRADGSVSFISTPDNGITSRYTWLTTSEDALLHLRIGFGSIFKYKQVVMYTDGAEAICRGTSVSHRMRKFMLENKDSCEIGEILADGKPEDDATCIVVDCNKISKNTW